jgi:hypothetical protein
VQCAGSAHTTVSGVVKDPAGKNPLYNVIVYVPNAPVDPVTHGASCDKCGSVASHPVVATLTDTKGQFVLQDVPVGDNIPLIVQVGKWRRQLTLPHVDQCVDNPIANADQTRLPRNTSEGDMPKIALATGCDPMECLFRKIGIADTEFTDPTKPGMVHLYNGVGGANAGAAADAYAFWADLSKMKQYDIVINACECSPYDRRGAYPMMHDYLMAGGRVFASHYHYNWFAQPTGPADFQSVANWTPNGSCQTGPNMIDDTFPKGKAFADWLVNVGASTTYGQIPLSCAPRDVASAKPPLSQQWIFDQSTKSPSYLSFNTPLDAGVDDAGQSNQCGRAVFADLHVASPNTGGPVDSPGGTFPSGCHTTDLSPQEKALEFMFFDLAACVQLDSQPPAPPVPH